MSGYENKLQRYLIRTEKKFKVKVRHRRKPLGQTSRAFIQLISLEHVLLNLFFDKTKY